MVNKIIMATFSCTTWSDASRQIKISHSSDVIIIHIRRYWNVIRFRSITIVETGNYARQHKSEAP